MSDSKPQRPRQGPLRSLAWVRTPHILAFSSVIHLGLLIYAQHVDTHPEAYGGLKYTDVDWRVVVDGARHIWRPTGKGDVADGLVGRYLNERGLRIGDPYHRATFRYTPLLPLIPSPALIHDLFGKVILSLISLAVPLVLLACRPTPLTSTPGASPGTPQKTDQRSPYFWPVHLLWTLNPFVLNITTRGSPEAIIILIVVACFAYLRPERGSAVAPRGKDEMAAAALFALAVSFKIYPIIYTPAIWSALSRRHGWLGYGVCRFGVVAASTMLVLNGALWLIWGQPFLEHTYLYHLSRLDHRHNFSPYFYGIYLSMLPPSSPLTSSGLSSFAAPVLPYLTTALQAIRHPLISFLPQATLVLALGWSMEPMLGLERTAFLQTAAFVVFNKVCTSQYFVWFIPLIPALIAEGGPLASASLASTLDATRARVADGRGAVESQLPRQHQARLAMSRRKAGILVAAWITGQAAWLGSAYRLELLAQDAYLQVWASGIALFGVSVWILGQLLDSVNFAPVAHPKTE